MKKLIYISIIMIILCSCSHDNEIDINNQPVQPEDNNDDLYDEEEIEREQKRTCFNNINITDKLNSLPLPNYDQETNDYVKKLYNKDKTFFYQEYKYKPSKLLDENFSGKNIEMNDKNSSIKNCTINLKLPGIWEKEQPDYRFSYKGCRVFDGEEYLYKITSDFEFKIENLYFLNNGVNRFKNQNYYTGLSTSDMDYIVIFDSDYPETGIKLFVKTNSNLVIQYSLYIPYTETSIIKTIVNSINIVLIK